MQLTAAYEQEIKALRAAIDDEVRSNHLNWINLVGLFWLADGENTFGSADDDDIALAALPRPRCGTFLMKDGVVTVTTEPGVELMWNGGKAEARSLRGDHEKKADLLEIGSLTMKVIRRGEALLLRVWDKNSELGKTFRGFKYFPVNADYRLTARYLPYHPPRPRTRVDIIGTESESVFLGQAQFTLRGKEYTLEAESHSKGVEFNFTDLTKDDSTYPGGRRFTVPVPQSETFGLDFNLAENWPCAYTPYATCPVPPMENRLQVRIEAGEKRYLEGEH